ncbi:MAG: hypothetical protein COX65_00955 [Elusimicrobia bacterium CG_4_10_14_0_2_um_filter_56_8]|nr:MAG: hypothetical protein AUJ51_07390 [Elusimicrobia bacterium CG1_02_56_21]PJA17342.1 MAG: hypothetical protein COX65_00955 [Elusimicrobia bacterium CG_4_10_14_0_2_um_filter_56_8]
MQEGDRDRSWLIWLIIVPVCMALGALLVRWALHPGSKQPAPPKQQAAAAAPDLFKAQPAPAAQDNSDFDLPGDEPDNASAAVLWTDKPSFQPGERTRTAKPRGEEAAPADAAPADPKKDRKMGFAFGALSKAAEKLLNNPRAVGALLNNDYIVKGFMSRDTVKKATASSSSLAAYLKNPKNLSDFMNKPAVQGGMNSNELVNTLASSKLTLALMDTPGGRALLKDPNAIGEILQANPDLVGVLTNPNVLSALTQNPRTAAIIGQIR